MKTSEIISSQFHHINSNIGEYFFMALPLIIAWSIFLNKGLLMIIITTIGLDSGNYILYVLFTVPVVGIGGLYFFFYSFRYAVNVHRFVILQEKIFFAINKNFKVTVIYWLKFLIIFIFIIILFFISTIFVQIFSDGILEEYSFSNPVLIYLDIYSLLDILFFLILGIIFSIILSFLALILPQAAIGKKTSIIETIKNSKNVRLTLFIQTLIIYTPYLFFNEIISIIIYLAHLKSFYLGLYTGIMFSMIYMYLITLYLGCLSRTYLLWKETINKNYI